MRAVVFGGLSAVAAAVAGFFVWSHFGQKSLSEAQFAALYAEPLPPLASGVSVYHLGHSLVGRDMPAMLAQFSGHRHASQLGWGASLKGHWTGDVPGFKEENGHPNFRAADQAIDSGDYAVVVLTEMVEIKDAIRYFDSADYLSKWAVRARAARPDVRLYLYETWHQRDDPKGWLDRIDHDLDEYWEGKILRVAMARDGVGTVYIIPGGQVMAAAVRAIESGEVPGLTSQEDLFAKTPDGATDQIHFNEVGAWLMAMTHYAVIYQKSPEGLPAQYLGPDGATGLQLSMETALALQRIVWDVVTGYAATGVTGDRVERS